MRYLLIAGLLLTGCAQARQERANAQLQAAADYCRSQAFQTQSQHAECINTGITSAMTTAQYPYPDLLQLQNAYRSALAEKVDRGEMSRADAQLAFSELTVRLETEAQNRQATAIQSYAAGQVGLSALLQGLATVRMANQPVYPSRVPITCQRVGNFIQCI